jgi:glycosyltransferase involved in cell wall biosynthesis
MEKINIIQEDVPKEVFDLLRDLPEFFWIKEGHHNKGVIKIKFRSKIDISFNVKIVIIKKNKIFKRVRLHNQNSCNFSFNYGKFEKTDKFKFTFNEQLNDYSKNKISLGRKKVSVIIPVKNQEESLRKTLAGISIQDIKPNEVIICDDGSEQQVNIDDYKKYLNIKLIRNKKSEGRSRARNKIIQIAKYPIIVCLDADMVPNKNLIREYLKVYSKYKRISILGGRRYINPEKLSEDNIKNKKVDYEKIRINNKDGDFNEQRIGYYNETKNLRTSNFPWLVYITCNCSFLKSDWIKAGGFNEQFNGWGYEDQEFGFRLFKYAKVKIVPHINALAYHQEHLRGKHEKKEEKKNFLIFLNSIKKYLLLHN